MSAVEATVLFTTFLSSSGLTYALYRAQREQELRGLPVFRANWKANIGLLAATNILLFCLF